MHLTKARLMPKAGLALFALASLGTTLAGMAAAQDALPVIGRPHQGGMGFQPAATVLAREPDPVPLPIVMPRLTTRDGEHVVTCEVPT